MIRRVVRQEIKGFFDEQLARDAAEARERVLNADEPSTPENEEEEPAEDDAE